MGDFNLDLLRYDEHAVTQELIDSLFSYMFIPIITRPTRLTAHTATLIDNTDIHKLSHTEYYKWDYH